MTIEVALIRQEQTGGDGGAQAIIDLMLQALGQQQDIKLSLLCRQWDSAAAAEGKVIIDPPFRGRRNKQESFNQAVKDYLGNRSFDIIQSHERLNGCHIFRAGDGVHKVWLQHRAEKANPLQRWWQSASSYHRALLAEEKLMFESDSLKKVICNSNMVREEIASNFAIDKRKLAVIYNAVDSQKYKPAEGQVKAELRQTLDIPENALVFIFAGSGFERKNLGATLVAFSQLPENCYLVVVGRDKKHRAYERLANQLRCVDRVRFLGAQEKSKMPGLYQLADVLVLPTIYDPFPNVILEALATGLPCITTTTCGAVDVIPDAKCGAIVDMADDQGLTDAMACYQDADRLNAESASARELALTFTQQRMQESLLGLYRELLD